MEALTHSRFSSVYLIGNRSISITNRPGWLFCLFQKCAVHGIPNLDVSFYKTAAVFSERLFRYISIMWVTNKPNNPSTNHLGHLLSYEKPQRFEQHDSLK